MKLLVIYGSSRENGNTEALTGEVLNQLESNCYSEIKLRNYEVKPVVDERHSTKGFQSVNDDYDPLVKMLIEHDAVLFVTPLYWYSMSGLMKNFVDRWTESLRNEEYDFKSEMKDKKMYVLTVGGPKAPITALPLIQQFQHISNFMEMEMAGYVIGKGVKPLEVLEDSESVLHAQELGKKIKNDLFYNN